MESKDTAGFDRPCMQPKPSPVPLKADDRAVKLRAVYDKWRVHSVICGEDVDWLLLLAKDLLVTETLYKNVMARLQNEP